MIAPAGLFAQKLSSIENLKTKIFECGKSKTKSTSKSNRPKKEIFQFSKLEKQKFEERRKRNTTTPPLSDHLRATICGRRIEVETLRNELCVCVQELFLDLDRRDWLCDAIEQSDVSTVVYHRGVTLWAAASHDYDGQPFLLAKWLERFRDSPPRAWYLFAVGSNAIEIVSAEIDRQWNDHISGKNPTFMAYA